MNFEMAKIYIMKKKLITAAIAAIACIFISADIIAQNDAGGRNSFLQLRKPFRHYT